MKSEFREPEYWAYEKRPWYLKRKLMSEGADHAEWKVPEGRVGGLVRQQRRRAHVATRRGRWLFLLLVLVIALGMIYYVAVPLWQQFQDGTKRGLEAEARLIESQLIEMDEERNRAWDGLRNRLALTGRYFFSGELISRTENSTSFTAFNDQRLIRFRLDGRYEYTDDAALTWSAGAIPFEDSTVEIGSRIVGESEDQSEFIVFSRVLATEESRPGQFDRFPVYYTDDGGETWITSNTDATIGETSKISRVIQDGSILLLVTDDGVARSTDNGANWSLTLQRRSEFWLTGPIEALYADNSDMTESPAISFDKGETWNTLTLPEVRSGFFSPAQLSADLIVVELFPEFADAEPVFYETRNFGREWFLVEDETLLDIPAPVEPVFDEEIFTSRVQLGEQIFSLGFDGARLTVRRDDIGGEFVASIEASDIRWDLLFSDNLDFLTVPVRGSESELWGTTDGGETWQTFLLPFNSIVLDVVESVVYAKDDFAVFFDAGSESVRLDDDFLTSISLVDLPAGREGDERLSSIASDLPLRFEMSEADIERLLQVFSIFADRQETTERAQDKRDQAAQIAGTGFSPSQRRLDYTQFLAECSSETAECVESYIKLQELDKESTWVFLYERVPAGVLILFLLATLGGLYRYNLRLSGFHHSRADALELLVAIYGENLKIGKDELTAFAGLADQMAADKVEFGKSKTPTDQAVELARAISGR